MCCHHLSFCQIKFENIAVDLDIIGTFGDKSFYSSGLSFVDFDKDGWDDVVFGSDRLEEIFIFHNNKGEFFEQLSTGINNTFFQRGILWIDIDNDGDLDFLHSNFAGQSLHLYENVGNLNFVDITSSSGTLDDHTNGLKGAVSAADMDNDGFLDFIATGFVSTNLVYLNNGNNTFSDITSASGLMGSTTPSFVHYFFDYNHDLFPDIYTAIDRDLYANELYENNGDLTFTNIASAANADLIIDAMSVTVGDINNDGEYDIYVTNTVQGNVLLLNNGDGTFTDIASSAAVTYNSFCWGANFADFNNDGYQDLFVASMLVDSLSINRVFMNNGDLTFTEVQNSSFVSDSTLLTKSFSSAIGDFDNNGKIDIAVSNGNYQNFQLWQNQSINANNYVDFDLEGVISNRDAVGVTIEVHCGALHQYKYTTAGNSFQAQDSKKIHFGLANHSEIDSIILKWPSGIVDKLYNVRVNNTLRIKEGMIDKTICDNTVYNQKVSKGILRTETYENKTILSSAKVLSDTVTTFRAAEKIILHQPFTVSASSIFEAKIEKCFDLSN